MKPTLSSLNTWHHGDEQWDLYNKKMKSTWKKIQIELDSVSTLSWNDIKEIADIAKEQADEYCKDCVNLYSRFNAGDKR